MNLHSHSCSNVNMKCMCIVYVTAKICFSVSNFCIYLLKVLFGLKVKIPMTLSVYVVSLTSNFSIWVRNNLLLAEKFMTSRNVCQIYVHKDQMWTKYFWCHLRFLHKQFFTCLWKQRTCFVINYKSDFKIISTPWSIVLALEMRLGFQIRMGKQ